jgi:SPP1 family predicted phage head-tail adaptor
MTLPISYKTPTVTPTASGGTIVTYSAGSSDFADITPVKVENENIADQTQEQNILRFKIHYRPSLAITDKWLIVFEGQDYKIVSLERQGLDKRFWLVKGIVYK